MKIKRLINIIIIGVLTLISIIIMLVMHSKINSLPHENKAKEFSGGSKFAQITVFVPESAEFTVDKVMYARYELDTKLVEKAIEAPNENARLYCDAYAAYKSTSLSPGDAAGQSARSAKVKIAYIGGDYSRFHSEFLSSPDICADINHDRILLSKTAAWQLFGGYELYDFEVKDGETSYFVSGVFDDYDSEQYKEFLGDSSLCLADIKGNTDAAISCYEILLVNPVTNFAYNLVKESIGLEEGTYYMVENSARFSLPKLFKKIPKLLNTDEQLPAGVVITPEETLALHMEKELAAMLAVLMVTALYPVIWALILLYRLIQLIKRTFNRFVISPIKDKLSYS